jgi:hypothetical protein
LITFGNCHASLRRASFSANASATFKGVPIGVILRSCSRADSELLKKPNLNSLESSPRQATLDSNKAVKTVAHEYAAMLLRGRVL